MLHRTNATIVLIVTFIANVCVFVLIPKASYAVMVAKPAEPGTWARFAEADQRFGATVTVLQGGRTASRHVDRGSSAVAVARACAEAATSLGIQAVQEGDTVTLHGQGIAITTYGVSITKGGDN